ncbi:hypothetical protein MMC21_000790 [Puttea exsequens]|nr:hypothetical protein [Puttea exsequens]
MSVILLLCWNVWAFSFQKVSVHDEHEREISHETERETQIERPPKADPLAIEFDVRLCLNRASGRADTVPASHTRVLKSKSVHDPGIGNRWIDMRDTVKRPQSGYHNNYLRPVNWVLTSKEEPKVTHVLILLPFEANALIRDIQKPTAGVCLHTYEPRVTKSMMSVDFGLELPTQAMDGWQSLDRGLRHEFNHFAGQLYFNTFKDYISLYKELRRTYPFWEATLSFVKSWIAIRRNGKDFLQSHVGCVLSGRVFDEGEWEVEDESCLRRNED